MNFRTELLLPSADYPISLHHHLLSVGSCFAEVMGNRLRAHKFQVLINPFGAIFNPVSIAQLLMLAANRQSVAPELTLQRDGYWYHYQLHSTFAAESEEALLQQAERALSQTGEFIRHTDFLLITLGTAFGYRLKAKHAIVANCHKMPADFFTKELLSVSQITDCLQKLISHLQQVNSKLRMILTVSPVRHVKDGIVENQVSKSILRVACHELAATFPHVTYFPAYELMMDDLRDYRFYQPDMIHPTEMAEDYIWEKFTASQVDEPAQNFIKKWQQLRRAIAHRPFNPKSVAHQQFLRKTLEQVKAWENLVDVSAEVELIKRQLF